MTIDGRAALSVNEVAKLLGVSRARMYRLMDAGELFYIQPGGNRLIPSAALEAFLNGQQYSPNAGKAPQRQADLSTWPPTPSILDSEGGA